ncbi:MAG: uroporphyrinogen decarboxylase family protein [Spirochaetia bacterium]
MTSRDRVRAALQHTQPDVTPCDYFSTPEIHQGLKARLNAASRDELLDKLGVDIRYVRPPYIGPKLPTFADGSKTDVWGIRWKPMPNEYGDYAEPLGLPYAPWTTVEEAAAFPWPSADWYDYSAIPALCARYTGLAVAAGDFGIQDFINGTGFGRGVEQVLVDIALRDPVFLFIVEKRHRFAMEHIDRILTAANGRIDLVLCGDDFGSQRGALISPLLFDELFAARKKEFFDMVHTHGARVSHHCCGSSRAFFPRFIALGMDSIQTIQPRAEGMNPYSLKAEFGGSICLHGAVDVQGWLQQSRPEEIRREVHKLMDEVGRGGGYILAPSHNLQPDTPIDNVLAVYAAVAERRDIKR